MLAAAAAVAVSITSFQLERVNSEVSTVRPGGSHKLCQAIPITVVRARVRNAGRAVTVRSSFKAPGHAARVRTAKIRHGRVELTFTPRTERLEHEAFPEGTYTLTLTRGGKRVARASFSLTGGSTC